MNLHEKSTPSKQETDRALHEKYLSLTAEDLDRSFLDRICPLDGSPLSVRDDPRTGVGKELFCSCGFANTG